MLSRGNSSLVHPAYTGVESMHIVSANYRDRQAKNRWLVRDFGAKPAEAVEASVVYATGVAFCPSSDFERGFGCSVIAQCQAAVAGQALPTLPNAVSLKFDGHGGFYVPAANRRQQDRYVETVAALILKADGSMLAVLKGEVPQIAAPAPEMATA